MLKKLATFYILSLFFTDPKPLTNGCSSCPPPRSHPPGAKDNAECHFQTETNGHRRSTRSPAPTSKTMGALNEAVTSFPACQRIQIMQA
ncbi:hypothetical protein DMR_32190 [Solidesulfovibrio magneticus RS-1]|uniref:Uncharacterized protein n=1 Tax=Solidesulfovibrio magneticus (strain ATCC 700980 / DSM 13731 / RS-1) TaxID=573370 RepID=C4XJG0_SOLM1|nr:hypothetical protein DMR_32190 [Solidesulfovibrio magneticus RS-1]